MPNSVTHCICANISFEELKILAEKEQLTLEELMKQTKAGLGCSNCRPYLEKMLETGQTSFPPFPLRQP